MKELISVQRELKAPKGQYNDFGKYKYRSAEDILEAVKPILEKNGLQLTLTDELQNIGTRYYIKATATLKSASGEVEIVTAYAREDESKKGMDGSQITGTASSYARKYALNGLFLIDDTKDADTNEYVAQTSDIVSDREWKTFTERCKGLGADYKEIAKETGAKSRNTMTKEQYGNALIRLKEIEESK